MFQYDIQLQFICMIFESFILIFATVLLVLIPKEFFNNWDNDVSIFVDFENQIKDSLQNTIDKFEKAFW
jgi:hypothetical protein